MLSTLVPLVPSSGLGAVAEGWQRSATVLYGSQSSASAEELVLLPVLVVGLLVGGVVGLVWIRSRARLQEKRFELIRELAASGKLDARTLGEELRPRSRAKSGIFVVAWFLLFAGVGLMISAASSGWPDRYDERGGAGVTILLIGIATLSAPIALREMRRHAS